MPTATFTAAGARKGTERPLAWLEFDLEQPDLDLTTHYWSDRAINDDATPRKAPRVLEWGTVRHALSSWRGDFEGQTAGLTLADTDRALATLLTDAEDQYWLNRETRLYLTHALARAAGDDPLLLMRGILRSYQGALSWQWGLEDLITSEFGGLGTDVRVPKRTIRATEFPTAPATVLGLPEPILYGELTDTYGAVPAIYVGLDDITPAGGVEAEYLVLLVAGHACTAITGVWQGGADLWGSWLDGEHLLVPGQLGWPGGATPYVDIGTRRYTLIYMLNDGSTRPEAVKDGSGPLYLNVQGIEANGDGTGALISQVSEQFFHCLEQFILGDYQSGAWLASPQWADGTDKVSLTSFQDLTNDHNTRLPATGYEGAGAIGLDGLLDVRTLIQRWCVSCDCQIGFTTDGQIIVRSDDTTTPTATMDDVLDIAEGSFGLTFDAQNLFTFVPYLYRPSFVGSPWLSAAVRNATAATAWKLERVASELEYWFLRDATTVENAAAHWLRRHLNPWRVSFETGLQGVSAVELGQIIDVTHALGLGATGYSARAIRVEAREIDPFGRVVIQGTDRDAYGAISYTTAAWSSTRSTSTVATLVPDAGTLAIAFGERDLGGDRDDGKRNAAWHRPRGYRLATINWSQLPATATARAEIEVRTDAAGTSVTPRVYNVTDSAIEGAGSPAVNIVWNDTTQTITISRPADNEDKTYVLELLGGNTNAAVYGVGSIRISP